MAESSAEKDAPEENYYFVVFATAQLDAAGRKPLRGTANSMNSGEEPGLEPTAAMDSGHSRARITVLNAAGNVL
jgi:hypothetical protein